MGKQDSTIASISCSQPQLFELVGSATTVPPGGSITSYTMRPHAGLAAGKYTAAITLTYNNGAVVTGNTEFDVLPAETAPTPTPTPTPTYPQTGDSGGVMPWLLALAVALLGLAGLCIYRRRAARKSSIRDKTR